MVKKHHTDETIDCGLHRFERNRFFNGKLMTSRDMKAEQDYHRNRLRILAQHVTGEGIVCGLETTVKASGDSLVVSIEPGLAFDCCGRPIVVETKTTEEIDLTEVSDPTSLYIDYDDCVKETVPVPGSEDACQEECTYNRILEIFEIKHRPEAPGDLKPVREIEFPETGEADPNDIEDTDDTLRQIAMSYYEDDAGAVRPCDVSDDCSVFLGRFTAGSNEEWPRDTDGEERAYVYTNDMLYAAIARHTADFGNPHEVTAEQAGALVSVDGVVNPGGNVDLVSTGSVLIEPDDDANEIGFEATAESVGALSSLDGVENPGGDVDLVSPDDTVIITPDDNANTIELQTSAAALGALVSVDGVENPGGNVDLTSSDDSIAIDPDDDANGVDLRVSDDIQGRFEEFEEQLGELKSEFEAEIEALHDRLGPLERYVMDKTLKYKHETFTGVAERFDTDTGPEIVEIAEEAIAEEVFRDRESYFRFLREVAELEERLVDELEGQATEESLERYAQAIQRLIETLDDEEQVVEAAVEQDFVCENVERLERQLE